MRSSRDTLVGIRLSMCSRDSVFRMARLIIPPSSSIARVVTRTILEHGRKSDTYYYLELTSWRAKRTHEKVMVSERWYLEAKPETRRLWKRDRGAFGIPFLVSVHRPE